MNTQTLREHLAQLHTELNQTTTIDESTQAELRALINDAQTMLNQSKPAQQPSQALSQRFQGIVAQLETDHPRITNTIIQIGEALSHMGF